jgi:hypothetical protein
VVFLVDHSLIKIFDFYFSGNEKTVPMNILSIPFGWRSDENIGKGGLQKNAGGIKPRMTIPRG